MITFVEHVDGQPLVEFGSKTIDRRPWSSRSAEYDRCLADLMRSAQEGDKAAYARLLGEVSPLLRQVVRRRYGFLQPPDIEDLVQEILLSLHTARATYDPQRPFLPWLMAIARNRMADGARSHARRSLREVAVERLPETFSGADTNTHENVYGDREALRQAMHHLPPRQREAVTLLKLREMSLKEAATITGMSIGALKVAVHRAVRTLRTLMDHKA
jgi:RNA polymerase sigma factor (sigma-70 family)